MDRRTWEDGNEGASNAVSVSRARMERRIRRVDSASARNQGESSGGTAEEGRGEKVIRWERFLPRRFLRVLLVECDDPTRHIVAALLRKCSYQVAAVADGLKAWEFLKEKHYNFDLVLTEVSMPSLSGISLLSKIMSNDVCKHIPVIMMSSHDSIGIVFKCMLEGAVDFLVKPVRKNELRNLWQHVWRKYCSSRCGNGYINENPDQEKYEAMSNNNADRNHASANAGDKSRTRNSYEKESDTQSSCSKPEAENECERPRQEPIQTENRSFSREIESKLDKYDADVAQMAPTPSMQEDEEAKDKLMGLEVKVTLSIQAAASTEKIQEENGFNDRIPCREDQGSLWPKEDFNSHPDPSNQSNVPNEPSRQIIDFIGTTATGQCSYTVLGDNGLREDVLCEATEFSSLKDSVSNFGSSPLWELSLRRSQINSLGDHAFQERHVLRHSDASAFSRYGKTRSHSCPKSGSSASLCIGANECSVNCHPQAGSDETGAGKNVPLSVKEKNGSGGEALMYCKPLSGSNKEDAVPLISSHSKEDACVGQSSTEEKVLSHSQLGAFPLPIPVNSIPFQSLCTGYGAILQPIFYPNPSIPVHGSATVQKVKEAFPYDRSGHTGIHLSNNLQYINCQQCNQNCVPHQSRQGMVNHRVDIETMDARALLQVTEEADQSASCSKSIHKGSGSNGSNEDMNAAVIAGAALESGNEDGFQSCSGQGLDRDRARREAALIKFRLKRKDRCFEKKVRYHSRKKLAEQRPRLKGQFVRQPVVDGSTTAMETDDWDCRKKLAEQRPRLKGQFVHQAVVDGSTTATETDDWDWSVTQF